MGRLSGKVALVSGAASGMGAATARLFIAEGAKVMLGDVNSDGGNALAEELGPDAAFQLLDVSDPAHWTEAATQVEEIFGKLDILAHFAGIPLTKPLAETTMDEAERLVKVNYLGTFLAIKAVTEPMKRAGGGAIIAIGSTSGVRAAPAMGFYGSTKFAVRGLVKNSALELAPFKIRVNAVLPGVTDTPMLAKNGKEFNDQLLTMMPLGRFGTPEEIASAVLFLGSDEATYITAIDLPVDGGVMA